MPAGQTRTIQEIIDEADDWDSVGTLTDTEVNRNGSLEINTQQPYNEPAEVLDSFGNHELWDGDGHEFNIIVECKNSVRGDLIFYPPDGVGYNSSFRITIGLLGPNGDTHIEKQQFYDDQDGPVELEDVYFHEGFYYYIQQNVGTNYQKQQTISNITWEERYGPDAFLEIIHSDDTTDDGYWGSNFNVDLTSNGSTVLKNDNKDEYLLGMGRTDNVPDFAYTNEANLILTRATVDAFSGKKVIVLDQQQKHGSDIQSTLQTYLPDDYSIDLDTVDNAITNDLADDYDVAVIQNFGSDGQAQDWLNYISQENIGNVYLGQNGSDSDCFDRLISVRGDPGFVGWGGGSGGSITYGNVRQDDYVFSDINNQKDIYTIHNTDNDRYVYADNYSGQKLSNVGTSVQRSRLFGFSRIDIEETKIEDVYNGTWSTEIEDFGLINMIGNNYVDWNADTTYGTDYSVEFSRDQANWFEAEAGESIPTVTRTEETGQDARLYMRVAMSTTNVEYTPVMFSLEWLIDEASADLESIATNTLTGTWTNCSPATGNIQTRYGIGAVNQKPQAIIQQTSANPLEADGVTADVKFSGLTATRGFARWNIEIDGVDKVLGRVNQAEMTYDTLSLDISASEQKVHAFLRDMEREAGRSKTFTLSSGFSKAIDLSEDNNTYNLIPRNNMSPPFYQEEHVLESYSEEVASNKSGIYKLSLKFAPKNPEKRGKHIQPQTRTSSDQWKFEMDKGDIFTRDVDAELESEVENGVKKFSMTTILDKVEAEIAYLSLLQSGASKLVEIEDGPSYPLDGTLSNANTIHLEPPVEGGFDITTDDYIVLNWRLRTAGDRDSYFLEMEIMKDPL